MPTGTRRKTGGVLKKNSRRRVKGGTVDASIPVPPIAVAMVGGKVDEPFVDPTVGLSNPGVLCYMNSTFQMLYSIPEIKTYFTDLTLTDDVIDTYTEFIATAKPGETQQTPGKPDYLTRMKNILKGVREVFNLMKQTQDKNDPSDLVVYYSHEKDDNNKENKELMEKLYGINIDFKRGEQQDANEALMGIRGALDTFTETKPLLVIMKFSTSLTITCKEKGPLEPTMQESQSLELPIPSNTAVDESNYDSLLNGVFDAAKKEENDYIAAFTTLKSKFECEALSIIYLITKYQEAETLTDTESMLSACSSDGKSEELALTQTRELTLPDTFTTLFLQLTRFKSDQTKITTPVDPTPQIEIDKKMFYLDGVFFHMGDNFNSGHYVYVKYKDGQPYKLLSDSTVKLLSEQEKSDVYSEIKTNGYVFLYRKGELDVVPQPPTDQNPKPPPVPVEPDINALRSELDQILAAVGVLEETAIRINNEINTILKDASKASDVVDAIKEANKIPLFKDLNTSEAYVKYLEDALGEIMGKKQICEDFVEEAKKTEEIEGVKKILAESHDKAKAIQDILDIFNKLNTIFNKAAVPPPPTPPTPPPQPTPSDLQTTRFKQLEEDYNELNTRIDKLTNATPPLSAMLSSKVSRLKDTVEKEIAGLSLPTEIDKITAYLDKAIVIYKLYINEITSLEKDVPPPPPPPVALPPTT